MSDTTANQSFFEKLFSNLLSVFQKAKSEVEILEHAISTFADHVTNVIKNNPAAVATLESLAAIAETINPALIPMINGLELHIPNVLNVISRGAVELSEPLQKQEQDFLNWLNSVKNQNPVVYAGIPASINASIADFVINNSGSIPSASPAQLLTAGQMAHANVA